MRKGGKHMKKSYNSFQEFKELSTIPRSEDQKEKSYQMILNKAKKNSGNNKWVPRTVSTFITIAACFIIALLTLSEDLINESTPRLASIEDKKILQSVVSVSHSEKQFLPKDYPYVIGAAISRDVIWSKAIRNILEKSIPTKEAPITQAKYDLLINVEDSEPIKLKIWVENDSIFFKEVNKNQFYIIPTSNAKYFLQTVKKITPELEK